MTRRSKSERNLDEEIKTLNFVLNLIEAGRLDHIYVHPHEKAAAVAFFKAKIEAAIKRHVRDQFRAALRRSRRRLREAARRAPGRQHLDCG
jgi:hypothetical protein